MKEFNEVEIRKSFARTDKLIAFKKELQVLINQNSIDTLFDLPDYVLASIAVGQMKICSMVSEGAETGNYHALLIA